MIMVKIVMMIGTMGIYVWLGMWIAKTGRRADDYR